MGGQIAIAALLAQFLQAPQSSDVIIKTTSHIVNVNVVAVDKHGNPVTDLKRDDFIVSDNGKRREIALFSLEASEGKTSSPRAPSATPLPFTDRVEQGPAGVTIILFDCLNTPWEQQAGAKARLIQYLRGMDSKDPIALYVLGTSLSLLHDFTSDSQSLIEGLNRRGLRLNKEMAESAPERSNSGASGADLLDPFIDASNQRIAAETILNREKTTRLALQAVAEHVARLPGRKNLVWIASSFPAAGQLARSGRFNLAIYCVDARALETGIIPISSGTQKANPKSGMGEIYNTPGDPTRSSIDTLAEMTGGRAFHDSNDIAAAIRSALSDGRATYALAFSPPEETLDKKFHRLKVQVKRPGISIRYRQGYFAEPDPPQPSLLEAMASGISFTGIRLRAEVKPDGGGATLSMYIDPRDITLGEQGGYRDGSLELVAGSSGAPGQLTPTLVRLHFSPDDYADVQKRGFLLVRKLPATSARGGYYIGVRDVASGAIGTVHIFE